jgi:hypothetical protein
MGCGTGLQSLTLSIRQQTNIYLSAAQGYSIVGLIFEVHCEGGGGQGGVQIQRERKKIGDS